MYIDRLIENVWDGKSWDGNKARSVVSYTNVIKKQWGLLRTVLYEVWCLGGGGLVLVLQWHLRLRLSGSSRRRVKVGFAASWGFSLVLPFFSMIWNQLHRYNTLSCHRRSSSFSLSLSIGAENGPTTFQPPAVTMFAIFPIPIQSHPLLPPKM